MRFSMAILRFQVLRKLLPLMHRDFGGDWDRHFNDIIQSCRRTNEHVGLPFFSSISKKVRTSDVVFILGSGASVHSVSDKEWNFIAEHDSFGVNFFIAHKFRPSLYFFETGWNEKLTDLFAEWRIAKGQEEIPLVLNGNLLIDRVWYEVPVFENAYVHYPYTIRSGDPMFVRAVLGNKCLRPFDDVDKSIHHGASLSFLIDIARIMGYKKIVLVGVDLSGPYFQNDYDDVFSRRLKECVDEIGFEGPHGTSEKLPEDYLLPIQNLIPLMQSTVLLESGVSLFQLRSNALLDTVPVYHIPSSPGML